MLAWCVLLGWGRWVQDPATAVLELTVKEKNLITVGGRQASQRPLTDLCPWSS